MNVREMKEILEALPEYLEFCRAGAPVQIVVH